MGLERLNVYLKDAFNFYDEAVKELEAGVRGNDVYRIRDAAEKAWNAVIQAANSLTLKYMGKVPSSHWERRKLLRELEVQRPELKKHSFRDRYGARERHLHEMVFYEGIIDLEDIKYEFEAVASFLNEVKELLST